MTRPSSPMRGRSAPPLALAACWVATALGACGEEAPTSVDVDLLPPEPITLEIQFPWAEFGSNLEVFGGYSSPADLPEGLIARGYAPESLDARTLLRFAGYPLSASVRDTTGTLRTDIDISFVGGYLVTFLDTIASTNSGPVTLGLGAMQQAWHNPSATWISAVDTVGDQQSWSEAGAGPVTPLTTQLWDPAEGDSVQFFLDSAQVADWNTDDAAPRSARIELLTDGERLRIRRAELRLTTLSSINPDTVLTLTSEATSVTFVYDLDPPPPTDGMRIGGAPSWRTVLDVAVPSELTGPPELCEAVGCPFILAPRHVSFASLALRSRIGTVSFQPTDSMALDVRPVLSRASLPKSPLGGSLISSLVGQRVGAAAFLQDGSLVEVPVTNFLKAFLAGPDPSGRPPPSTLALLAAPEPSSFAFVEFHGPGGPNEPVLNLIVTVSRPLELP